jgi:outer membrane protein assembly factor BamB
MYRTLFLSLLLGLAAVPGLTQMGGMGSAMTGGSGMLVVADDGSLLVTGVEAGMMGDVQRTVSAVSPAGQLRWAASFADGWPMMTVTQGDLVVVVLRESWWGGGSGGDTGWMGSGSATLVGLDLATGAERWLTELDEGMASVPQFAPDGTRLYLTVHERTGPGGPGGTPMHQGDAWGQGAMRSTSVVAIGRDGQVLWSLDLGGQGGGTSTAGRTP